MGEKVSTAAILKILEDGELAMEGLVPWGSNYTFLVKVKLGDNQIDAIYKPSRGERPLWDFARGTLCLRERAAFLIAEALGWHLVPPTVLRNGPHGWGSLQYFVDHDPDQHYLTFSDEYVRVTQQIALFDVIINNADRKSGHVLLDPTGRLWAIDHGVCFHDDYKLRSVIWEYADQPIPDELVNNLESLNTWLCYDRGSEYEELKQLLEPVELGALQGRLNQLIFSKRFPKPGPGRHYPWPLV
jgi:hypothetical protein